MIRRHPRIWLGVLLVAVAFAASAGGFGIWLAGEAGRLPWQAEPTRIAVTPFAGIPGFGTPTPTETSTSGMNQDGIAVSNP
jgi:hypothetical protein